MEIRLFKTSVRNKKDIKKLTSGLNEILNGMNWNFDLDDNDKVLRVESQSVPTGQLAKLLGEHRVAFSELY